MTATVPISKTDAQLALLLETHYAHICDSTESIRLLPGAEINSKNYRITCCKHGRRRDYLVKQRLPHMRDGEIEPAVMYQTLHHCMTGSHVPRVIQAKNGASYLEHENHLYAVLEYLDASSYDGDDALLYQIGHEIARLHRSLANLPDSVQHHCAHFGNRFHFAEGEQEELFDALAKYPHVTHEFWSLDDVDFVLNAFKCHHSISPRHPQVIHRDLHGENILVSANNAIWIIDFDALTYDDSLRDVAFACHRLSSQTSRDRSQIRTRAGDFLSGYHKQLALTTADLLQLPHYIVDEALLRISYILRKIFGHSDASLAAILPRHIRALRGASMLDKISIDIESQEE